MRRIILTTTALVCLTSSLANADAVADGIVQALQTQGYTNIEVLIGPTQLKVEAYQPGTKIEAIHDLATGAVLKVQTEDLEADDDEDFSPKVEIEDVAQDFLDSDGKLISDDEAYNDTLANQVTNALKAAGYTSVETLIGPTQLRAVAFKDTGETVVIIYDRVTGSVIRETVVQGTPYDDDFQPGFLIEDVSFDFLDADGNEIIPEDDDDPEEDIDEEEEEEDEEEEEEDDPQDDDDADDNDDTPQSDDDDHDDGSDDQASDDDDDDEDDDDAGNDDDDDDGDDGSDDDDDDEDDDDAGNDDDDDGDDDDGSDSDGGDDNDDD